MKSKTLTLRKIVPINPYEPSDKERDWFFKDWVCYQIIEASGKAQKLIHQGKVNVSPGDTLTIRVVIDVRRTASDRMD